jgi:NlpC/P60 family putative phage cell wall peptidase
MQAMTDAVHPIVATARAWIGTPYRHQASLKAVGCDCLGLIRGVYRELYGLEPESPPPYSPLWAEVGAAESLAHAARRHLREIAMSERATGDVLLFRWRHDLPAKHAAILASAQSMIHAQSGARVCEVPLSDWWTRRLAFAFRFPEVR